MIFGGFRPWGLCLWAQAAPGGGADGGPLPERRPLSVVVEQNLQPAGTGGDELPGVAGPPALGEADADAVGVVGPVSSVHLRPVLEQARALEVEHLDGVARGHLAHNQGAAAGRVQRRGVDEDGVLAPIVGPHAVRLLAEKDAEADLAARAPHRLAALLQVELAQAEAAALR